MVTLSYVELTKNNGRDALDYGSVFLCVSEFNRIKYLICDNHLPN